MNPPASTHPSAPEERLVAPAGRVRPDSPVSSLTATPSALYAPGPWKAARWCARFLPRRFLQLVAMAGTSAYAYARPERLAVVKANLEPVVQGSDADASRMARRLFREFGRKLADLWIYESGRPIGSWFGELTGWEHYVAAQARGTGVLLVTPHLGNWEFGAPLLATRQVRLAVVTLEEPGTGFTELRHQSRARSGVETFVVGRDPFGFLDLIRRLGEGATVALLIDRPPAATAVDVPCFGRRLPASIAAAELARATGCTLLPVVLPRTGSRYAARILPAVEYDRASLRTREARIELTTRLIAALAPCVRQHPDQWFHFVPVWSPVPSASS